ncbi:hypothetical protein Lal_00028328 [Lupinus albus]|nr:hypothetical protein Lal_00028328 [Lupinus albus]
MDRSIIDAASGGALGDMTPFEERSLIEKMASNSQQFNARSSDAIVVRGFHDVGTNAARQDKLETKIDSLTTLITQLAINLQKSSMARVCGICTSSDHYSDMCPSLLEPRTGDHPEAYAANIYSNRPPHQQQHYVPPPIQQQRHQMINTPAPTEPCLEELVQAATKPIFATFFPSVLQAPDWTPPFDLECDIVVYALGSVLASYEFDFLPP